jgi:CRP-like cAMP-binding protein
MTSSACSCPRPHSIDCLAEHPPIPRRWLSSIATRLARSHARIVALLGRPLAAQVARLLLDEAIDGIVRFPQGTLAAMLGVHRPALNRTLKELERQKAIEVGYGRIRVLDRAVLEGIAAG